MLSLLLLLLLLLPIIISSYEFFHLELMIFKTYPIYIYLLLATNMNHKKIF